MRGDSGNQHHQYHCRPPSPGWRAATSRESAVASFYLRKDSLECAGINKEDADRQCHYRDIYYVVSGKVTCWRHCCRGCGLQPCQVMLEWQLCVALVVCHCVTSFVATSLEEDSMN